MAKRLLVMLTDTYPFAVGEEFIEQEIEQVCQQFDKVLIIPVRVRKGEVNQTRTLPSNATALLLAPDRVRDWRAKTALYFPLLAVRAPGLIVNVPFIQPRRFLQDIRFGANVLALSLKAKRVLSPRLLARFDSVVFYAYWMHTPAVLGCLLRQQMPQPARAVVVARAHAYDVDESDAPNGYIPARKFLLDRLDQVYPISEYAAKFLRQHGPRHPHQIEVRRLGVPPVEPVKRTNHAPWHLLSCSHMAPYKRVDLMLEAVAQLQSRGLPVEWTHIGESNPQRFAAMQALAEERLQPGSYHLLGHLSNRQARAICADPTYTVFLNTSSGEGVPVTIMEAQAASLPVVATAAGGSAEIVRDGENGRVVAVESSPAQIADAIEGVLKQPAEDYQRMARAARSGWQERSNAPSQYADFARHLRVLSEGGKR